MATCDAGSECTIVCSGGCGCVYVPSEESCHCTCFKSVGTRGSGAALNAATLVNIAVSDLPLGRVGLLLDGILAREVLVPAARTEERVRLKLERVRLSHVVETLGLTTRRRMTPPDSAGLRKRRG